MQNHVIDQVTDQWGLGVDRRRIRKETREAFEMGTATKKNATKLMQLKKQQAAFASVEKLRTSLVSKMGNQMNATRKREGKPNVTDTDLEEYEKKDGEYFELFEKAIKTVATQAKVGGTTEGALDILFAAMRGVADDALNGTAAGSHITSGGSFVYIPGEEAVKKERRVEKRHRSRSREDEQGSSPKKQKQMDGRHRAVAADFMKAHTKEEDQIIEPRRTSSRLSLPRGNSFGVRGDVELKRQDSPTRTRAKPAARARSENQNRSPPRQPRQYSSAPDVREIGYGQRSGKHEEEEESARRKNVEAREERTRGGDRQQRGQRGSGEQRRDRQDRDTGGRDRRGGDDRNRREGRDRPNLTVRRLTVYTDRTANKAPNKVLTVEELTDKIVMQWEKAEDEGALQGNAGRERATALLTGWRKMVTDVQAEEDPSKSKQLGEAWVEFLKGTQGQRIALACQKLITAQIHIQSANKVTLMYKANTMTKLWIWMLSGVGDDMTYLKEWKSSTREAVTNTITNLQKLPQHVINGKAGMNIAMPQGCAQSWWVWARWHREQEKRRAAPRSLDPWRPRSQRRRRSQARPRRAQDRQAPRPEVTRTRRSMLNPMEKGRNKRTKEDRS
jgi:hypothetical protein